ncbi:aminoglycoside phosphotransferase family protein [Roseomonas sp. HJA6]|uniref:Aminoglycoside phosphotransferase family protein n=1 Tax=Roseomonas alba TaxID=2846776 RepID=A0ABS7A980_9PROT|nr:aminoglycoside phosphotransferase family protein [Neoroseomonas alba]MBW6398723.1 aminoglycoside phosphotransferase family protein [Neoroseomonas alba]
MRGQAGYWLVTSGAYVGGELAAEFGHLPPAFLPVGTARLYEYQLTRLAIGRPLYLTVPEGYTPPAEDRRRLEELDATLIHVPVGLTLGESVIYALNMISRPDQPVRILHGDTLFDAIDPALLDVIALSHATDGYGWAVASVASGRVLRLDSTPPGGSLSAERPVATGYFSFASSATLVRSLTRAGGDFIGGINLYAEQRSVAPLDAPGWLDFGNLQTFFRSRRTVTTARSFNSLRVDGRTVRKSSDDTAKMEAEAAWLRDIPTPLRVFSARLIDSGEVDGRAFYETEYHHVPTLSELFVFGTPGHLVWSQVLRSCEEFLTLCARHRGPGQGAALLQRLAVDKTAERLETFAAATGFDIRHPLSFGGRPFPSLLGIAEELSDVLRGAAERPSCVMHGDFCFSNILYDSRARRIRVIDPRGYIAAGEPGLYGDLRYDLAKLAHSILGRYDQIVAGRYSMSATDGYRLSLTLEQTPQQAWLQSALAEVTVDGVGATSTEVQAIMVGLFLSMLPLHADRPDRQRAFMANALRLFGAMHRVLA